MTMWGIVFQANRGSLHVNISQQQELIHNDTAKEDSNDHDRHLCHPKMPMQTQEDRSAGNYCKLDDPCNVSVRINGPSDYRVEFHASTFKNDYGEEGIQNIQHGNKNKADEQSVIVAVDIAAVALIFRAPESRPSTG